MNKIEYTTYVQTPSGFMCDRIETRSKATGAALIRTIMRTVRRRMANKKYAWMFTTAKERASVAWITMRGKKIRGMVQILTVAEVKL